MGMEKYSNTDWRIYGVLVHMALEADFHEIVYQLSGNVWFTGAINDTSIYSYVLLS